MKKEKRILRYSSICVYLISSVIVMVFSLLASPTPRCVLSCPSRVTSGRTFVMSAGRQRTPCTSDPVDVVPLHRS